MEKKNPFVITVGFKKEDPDHVYVAGLLNTMGRGKAQYIVKAVLAYRELQKKGEISLPTDVTLPYESIKQIVLQVIEERERQSKVPGFDNFHKKIQEPKEKKEEDILVGFDENAMNDILASIAAFQE